MPAGDNSVVFGARMKQLRESRRVSLREIADRTKISVSMLEAIERDDLSRLPGGIFSRAMVRAYAEAIGVDPESAVSDFIARFPLDSVVVGSPQHATHERLDQPTRTPMPLALLAVILVPLVAILVWSLLT